MNSSGLKVRYKVLFVLSLDWEAAIEDAAATVQSDLAPVHIETSNAQGILLYFLLYPANAHGNLQNDAGIEEALASMSPDPTARVVLAACAPTFPPVGEEEISELAARKLIGLEKKNAIRVLEPNDLRLQAEEYMRHGLRQLGATVSEARGSISTNTPVSALTEFEAQPWRM